MQPTVLFVCTHNSARSQMAEGLLRHRHGDRFQAFSAGTEATEVRPLAIVAMAEVGIDISGQRSKTVDALTAELPDGLADIVVTVCDSAREACAWLPARVRTLHRSFDDPSGATGSEEERLAVFRRVRDEIAAWLEASVEEWRAEVDRR